MSLYQWLCLLGIPSLLAAIFKVIFSSLKKSRAEIESVKLGVQALLRAQLVSEYNKWEDRGWAPIYARQNFENCWEQYHNLGRNGVMDDLHLRFLALPTEPPTKGGANDEKKED